MLDWLKKAPTPVVVAVIAVCGFLAAAVLASFVILQLQGVDTTEFRSWIQTLGQILVFPFLGVTAVASVQSARASSRTEDQTNGALTAKTDEIADAAAERVLLRLGQEGLTRGIADRKP